MKEKVIKGENHADSTSKPHKLKTKYFLGTKVTLLSLLSNIKVKIFPKHIYTYNHHRAYGSPLNTTRAPFY